MMEKQIVLFQDLGKVDYKSTWDYQDVLMKKNLEVKAKAASMQYAVNGSTSNCQLSTADCQQPTANYLLFVEHPLVYTIGKSGKMEHVLINEEERLKKGIGFYQTNRGGDITFHGPEQIVGYPILDLEKFYTDIGRYLRELEEVVILTLDNYGITAGRSPGETGVWINAGKQGKERKICAMGVRCSRWITMHGFALNVNTDLSYFDHIIPCGIQNKRVTSLKAEAGKEVSMNEVKERLKKNFENVFQVRLIDA